MKSEREAIKKLILTAGQEKPRVIVAIDGRCAAGKTTLAEHLKQELGTTVFHMDDFFLRPEQRTAERFSTPGGNVDYERFAAEILHPVRNGAAHVELRAYDCAAQTIQEPVRVPVGRIVLVEGSYSCHPALWDCYDLRIFLTVSPDVQRKRILERNGEEKLEVFLNRWIPMEERYFAAFGMRKREQLLVFSGAGWLEKEDAIARLIAIK
ncbi:MAG: uridine kinase [Oscillospiraceae bacterium]|nr:uridine kinase [Oscillospiraceae bacterium]